MNVENVRKTAGISSGIAQIAVSDNGANQIVIIPGANEKLNAQDVEKAVGLISNADVLVCQSETPIEVALNAIKLCKKVFLTFLDYLITDMSRNAKMPQYGGSLYLTFAILSSFSKNT